MQSQNTSKYPIIIPGMHPKILDALQATINEADARGLDVGLYSGRRTPDEQDVLYALGRTVKNRDGANEQKPMGNIVTNAGNYFSFHVLGLAGDLVFKDNNGNWTWDKKPEEWGELGLIGKMFGLSWGGDWTKFPDFPHFQMIGSIPNVYEAKRILFEQGLDVLWAMV